MRHCVSVNVKFTYILSGWVTIPTFMRLHAAVRTSSALQATTHPTHNMFLQKELQHSVTNLYMNRSPSLTMK